jgi:hypothetical protein
MACARKRVRNGPGFVAIIFTAETLTVSAAYVRTIASSAAFDAA